MVPQIQLKHHLGGKMKTKVNALIMLAVIFVAFTVVSSVKSHENAPQYSTAVLTDGGGPMCFPHTGCGYKNGVVPEGSRFSAEVLLAGGPGPMCPPDSGCGHAYDASTKNSVVS
jgi:hypothetical protein